MNEVDPETLFGDVKYFVLFSVLFA